MITAKIDFPCKVCGNKQKWYISPMDEKTKTGDYISSLTHYKITCKKCRQSYILKFSIQLLERKRSK